MPIREFFKRYSFIVIVLAIAGVGVLVYFRENISGLLVFRERPQGELNIPEGGEEARRVAEDPPVLIPPYVGRDPGEIRPDPKEIAAFGGSDLDKIYSTIRTHAAAVSERADFLAGWLEIGLLKKGIGDYEGARDAWEYASVIRPLNSVSFANLGELYWKYLPDYPKSEANFRASIRNKSDDIGTYMSLSDLYSYSYTQKKGLADDVLLEGLEANPGNTDLMRWLAALYQRENNIPAALEWWKKVLVQNPSDGLVKETITELEAKRTP
ncbi:MAG: hypothetical protein UY61_C0044G0004 [Candidatus Adlerbacteria bacterium GW2011_GWC1_50_9]|uniref:Uncharacterized protein n=2 Tax=Parcubacteria group TaxID=1794811 RepID=A0A0G1WMW9_9BACT|nr:MAG: hypothetical protein UY61_C0044G0004 [Candidatus Adlerbacteria bacterium GW2011_GWC1_50_9]KKW30918.1 MAG: hypothetical protein UY74_C0029G0003 [Candidatus Kaiserbacteria bacterium GW2011_GWC2_52_8b]